MSAIDFFIDCGSGFIDWVVVSIDWLSHSSFSWLIVLWLFVYWSINELIDWLYDVLDGSWILSLPVTFIHHKKKSSDSWRRLAGRSYFFRGGCFEALKCYRDRIYNRHSWKAQCAEIHSRTPIHNTFSNIVKPKEQERNGAGCQRTHNSTVSMSRIRSERERGKQQLREMRWTRE